MLLLESETEFAIDKFVYAPAKNKLKLSCKLTKGNLNYISGIIAKSHLEAVKITAPSGIISIYPVPSLSPRWNNIIESPEFYE